MTVSDLRQALEATYDCIRCFQAVQDAHPNALIMRRFIACPNCGNKRCPKATDHNLGCTGSNEPGQFGSDYP